MTLSDLLLKETGTYYILMIVYNYFTDNILIHDHRTGLRNKIP